MTGGGEGENDGVQRVINAPKEALLMKKIRGRVAYIVWDVYPTQR